MLKQRIITAVILVPLVIAALFYLPKTAFEILALAITLLAAGEFANFFKWDRTKQVVFLFLLVSIIFFLKFTMFFAIIIASPAYLYILFLGLIWWLITPFFLRNYVRTGNSVATKSPLFLGIIIFVPFWASVVVINNFMGVTYLLLLLGIVWAGDIGAYFAGMFFGKTLLAEKISPKKTIEGVVGGVLAALITAFIVLKLFINNIEINKLVYFMLLSVTVSLWSVIGDLFESTLKRQAGIKDSGNILPGHGGIYDRIDSLTAAAPIFTLGLLLI